LCLLQAVKSKVISKSQPRHPFKSRACSEITCISEYYIVSSEHGSDWRRKPGLFRYFPDIYAGVFPTPAAENDDYDLSPITALYGGQLRSNGALRLDGTHVFRQFPHPTLASDEGVFRLMIPVGMSLPYFTSYPVNVFLLESGWKEKMPQSERENETRRCTKSSCDTERRDRSG